MNSDYLLFILNGLKKRRLRSWLTIIGVIIGIAAVVSLIGLGEGLRTAVLSQFGFLGSDVLSIQAVGINFAGPPGSAVATPLKDDLKDKIARISGVDVAFNRHLESAALEFEDEQETTLIASVPEQSDRSKFEQMVNIHASSGRLLKDEDRRKIVIGIDYTNDDHFGNKLGAGKTVTIKNIPFEVAGVLKKKGSFIFDHAVFMNENEVLEMFGDKKTTDIIAVKVKNQDEINTIKNSIEKFLRKERDVKEGEEDFIVQSPQETLNTLTDTLFAVQLFVYVIAAISLLVGGIGIANTMYTSVLERTKEIGVIKSIGARNSTIFALYAAESGLLGFFGGIVGATLGMAFSYAAAALGKALLGSASIQANVSPFVFLGALILSFTIGTIAGTFPALRAARLKPVEALRFVK